MIVYVENRPPGGGGAWTALRMARAAASSAAWPDERVIAWLTTRPDGPMVKANSILNVLA
ncbi:hypothetical protein M2321_002439 [Rhodoblastus acidophilus]|jgi:hypothetical protein|nr:hypothetical protein [Rhodoblastus acidophilus]